MIESSCPSVNFPGIPSVQSIFTPTSVILGLDLATSSAVRSAASAASEHLEEAMLAYISIYIYIWKYIYI